LFLKVLKPRIIKAKRFGGKIQVLSPRIIKAKKGFVVDSN